MRILVILFLLTGCASKFAPVVSRPDNLKINCTAACDFDIPMNTEIMVAKNTNGWDAMRTIGIEGFRALPVLGMLGISWKALDTQESILEATLEQFGVLGKDTGGSPSTITNTTTNNTTTNEVTGDTISTTTDSSGSNNSSSADVATTTGDTIDSSGSGNSADTTNTTTNTSTVDYNNVNNPSTITYPVSP